MKNKSGDELVQNWQDQNKVHSFEGESGLRKLEDLCKVLGYYGDDFRFGNPIQQFLGDNPGACDKIVEFIAEWADRNADWHRALSDTIIKFVNSTVDEDEDDNEEE